MILFAIASDSELRLQKYLYMAIIKHGLLKWKLYYQLVKRKCYFSDISC